MRISTQDLIEKTIARLETALEVDDQLTDDEKDDLQDSLALLRSVIGMELAEDITVYDDVPADISDYEY